MGNIPGFDIIGDIHGHYAMLLKLLRQIGYIKNNSKNAAWHHPAGRRAIFVGDLIDRGPQPLECVRCVRTMVAAGSALCILGNHEYNAILYRLGWRRLKPTDPHHSFLAQVPPGSAEYDECLAWFWQLPLYLRCREFGVVHACWDAAAMRTLHTLGMGKDNLVTARLYSMAGQGKNAPESTPERTAYNALENILKGVEIDLPAGTQFTDKDGTPRHKIRARWWHSNAHTYRRAAFTDSGAVAQRIPDTPLHHKTFQPIALSHPVFIGHYWRSPRAEPAPLTPLLACVDYSAGVGGPLACYRWNAGDAPPLNACRFVLAQP